MAGIDSKEYFRIEGQEFVTKSGRWKARIQNQPDQNANDSDLRVFWLRFDLIMPNKDWLGEKVRKLKLTTSRAGLVVEGFGGTLLHVVEGFLRDEKPEGELTYLHPAQFCRGTLGRPA